MLPQKTVLHTNIFPSMFQSFFRPKNIGLLPLSVALQIQHFLPNTIGTISHSLSRQDNIKPNAIFHHVCADLSDLKTHRKKP